VDVYFETVPGYDLTVDPSKFHITAGEDPGGAPLTILGVSCLGEGHVRIQTAEQTQECYWLKCDEGAVTDFVPRPNELIHKPYMAAYPLDLSNVVAEGVGWSPTPDISGVNGQSQFIVWRHYPDSHMDVGWYDIAQDASGITPCAKWPYDLGVDGNTAVWYYEGWPEVYPAEICTQQLPTGAASLYAQSLLKPQLADGWLMYETEEDPPWVLADGLTSGGTVVLSSDASEFKERTLADGKAVLLYLDGSIELRDLATGLHEPLSSEPRDLSNVRMDDGRVVCLEDSERILVFDLREGDPVARELLDPTASWDRFELYGTTIVAYDSASGLWAGDLVKDPVRWKPLVLPEGYGLDDFDIYGPDIVASIGGSEEQMNVYLISP
ncbi:MAG TPA: hypothetical protein VLQ52_05500, partial [Coriobacteriia bacterium]|nr:hypothetical protein [Coriobacteriia bacterium]